MRICKLRWQIVQTPLKDPEIVQKKIPKPNIFEEQIIDWPWWIRKKQLIIYYFNNL